MYESCFCEAFLYYEAFFKIFKCLIIFIKKFVLENNFFIFFFKDELEFLSVIFNFIVLYFSFKRFIRLLLYVNGFLKMFLSVSFDFNKMFNAFK